MTRPLWKDRNLGYPTSALPTGEHFDAVVVGAGFTGLTSALQLAEAGRSAAVIESRSVGAGASGATTAKATLLQSDRLSQLASTHHQDLARDYLAASRFGLEWLDEFCEAHRLPVQRTSAYTFASTAGGVEKVRAEHQMCQELGLPTRMHDSLEAPFPVHAAVELPDQLQFDPTDLLVALTAALTAAGGLVVDQTRVTGLEPAAARDHVTVETSSGQLTADQVILATATPILDRGVTSAQLTAQRSYLCAFDPAADVPAGMLISVESPARSLRTALVGESLKLLVGGNGHRTGQARSTREQLQDLETWTAEYFPDSRLTHSWSAQDYHPAGMVPMVESLSWGKGLIHFAGGYSKWGVTGAPAAARQVVSRVLGEPETVSFGNPSAWGTAKNAVKSNANAPRAVIGNLLRAESGDLDSRSSADDEGSQAEAINQDEEQTAETGRDGLKPAGEATVDGRTCRVSLTCPHLGATLAWNDAEESWDCPLHGSRFAADGALLEGPATTDLTRL